MNYHLDYVGPGIKKIAGIGDFGEETREEVVRNAAGDPELNEDGTPITKKTVIHFGPHQVSESVAQQYKAQDAYDAGWRVIEEAELASPTVAEEAPPPDGGAETMEDSPPMAPPLMPPEPGRAPLPESPSPDTDEDGPDRQ